MAYLRLVHSAPPAPTPESACLDAFERELEYIFATLGRLGAAQGDVEDLAQEIFMVLYQNWTTLDTERSLRPYLFGVAFRIVCAHRRRRGREVPHATLEIDDRGPGPEASMQSREAMAILLAALGSVPIERRAVVIMHELDEIPIADIARALGITRFGAYARLRKGRKELSAAVRRLSRGGAPR